MENTKYVPVKGIGVTGILGVVFIVLRLCKVIEWPWLWVLSPFWIPLAIGAAYMAFVLIYIAVRKRK